MTRVQQAGERIESLLAGLRSQSASAAAAAEELTGLLVSLYGDGLGHIVAGLRSEGSAGEAALHKLAEDPLVESLLLLHGLHPLDTDTRIQQALDRVRPYLGSHAGGVQYLGVDGGVARLRLEGSCHGCPSSTVTVRLAIEGAVQEAAPEVSEVVVEGMTEPPGPALLQIGPRPDSADGLPGPAGHGGARADGAGADGAGADGAGADGTRADRAVSAEAGAVGAGAAGPGAGQGGQAGHGGQASHGGWVPLPDLGPPSSRPVAASAAGNAIVVCAVRGTLYAYRDQCAGCGSSLADGGLERGVLTCRCGARYDVCRAGAGLSDTGLHLDPLPLLSDSTGVRVAVPVAVGP
jgi:Fe-S cluster biogenesis protein NfuA/nitrite reductase/ring-hydroxylating ferredoxin subunit